MVAPASRNAMVTSRPRPPVPPVTRTILSWKFILPPSRVRAVIPRRHGPSSAPLQVGISLNSQCSPKGERYKNLLPSLLEELRHQPSPPGLVARAQSRSSIPMKIFIKQDQIAPKRIVLKFLARAIHRPVAIFVAQKNMGQRSRDLRAYVPQRHLPARAGRALHAKVIAIIMMKFLQRLDHQEIHREPDGPAPVRVSAEQTALRLARFVVHSIFIAVDREKIRMRCVIFRQRADAVRRKELFLADHVADDPYQLFAVH